MDRIDTLISLLRQEIVRDISEESSSPPKTLPDDSNILSRASRSSSMLNDTKNSEERGKALFPNRSPAQVDAALKSFQNRWAKPKKQTSIYDDVCWKYVLFTS